MHTVNVDSKNPDGFYKTVIENSRTAILVFDQWLNLKYVNGAVSEITGYSREDLLSGGVHWDSLVRDDDLQKVRYFHNRRQDGDPDIPLQYECSIIDRNGVHRGLLVQVGPVPEENLSVVNIFDVTHWKRYEERLLGNEEKLNAMVELSQEISLVVGDGMQIEYATGAVLSLLGYGPHDLIGRCLRDLIHDEDKDQVNALYVSGITDLKNFDILDFRLRVFSGEYVRVEANCNNQLDNFRIGGVILTIRDISARKKAEEKARFFQHYDYLTRLPNRRMFFERIGLELRHIKRRAATFAVLCIGLDRFKEINDLYGPKMGDRILIEIGEDLNSIYRKEDSVARLEGDKFAVLLTDIKRTEHVVPIVQKTLDRFSHTLAINGEQIRVAASIGVAVYPDDGQNEEQLIRNCETAMFMAKEKGRSAYQFYNRRQHTSLQARRSMQRKLERAVGNDEFFLQYQPKVGRSGQILGAEALARWKSPDLGIVPPDTFIPVVEQSGLIVEFGREILRNACSSWLKMTAGEQIVPQLAVNLSPFQFCQPDLVKGILDILEETGFDPAFLELEITETGIMQDQDDAVGKLKELTARGIKIAIDDFGTGYSSLKQLKDFPVDTIKIDKSFLENLNYSQKSSTIINAIIGLSHDLGFSVVAEGVEHREQLDFLQQAGCDIYQGYLFGKPMSGQDFTALRGAPDTAVHFRSST